MAHPSSRSAPAPDDAMLDTQRMNADRYWSFARGAMRMAIVLHLGFGIAGVLVRAPLLTVLQIVSVAVYAGCYALSYRHNRGIITPLVWVDLLGHATLACWIVGPASGYQFYSWILMPLIFLNTGRALRTNIIMAAALIALYMGIDVWLQEMTPLVRIDPLALSLLRYFNITAYLVTLGLIAVTHTRGVHDAEEKLRSIAGTDALTGLLNRRRMSDRINQELMRARLGGKSLTVLLLDIDNFKVINDLYGHGRGDEVITRVSEVLRGNVRDGDTVARWGGEEFLILLPESTMDAAYELAERVRSAVAANIVRDGSSPVPVTVTIGAAAWSDGESLEATIQRADAALYEGKRAGRNLVVIDRDRGADLLATG